MKATRHHVAVLVTVPDLKTGRAIARAALDARVAACVNLVPGIESHYWWKGKVERGRERLLVIKTRRAHLAVLEEVVHAHHPYDTPEFVVLPIAAGSARYLGWIDASVRAGA